MPLSLHSQQHQLETPIRFGGIMAKGCGTVNGPPRFAASRLCADNSRDALLLKGEPAIRHEIYRKLMRASPVKTC